LPVNPSMKDQAGTAVPGRKETSSWLSPTSSALCSQSDAALASS
jgi:hypothetical protein